MTNDEIVEMKSERPMTWSLMAEFLDELRADTFEFQGGQYLSATAEEMCNGLSLMRDKITAVLARVETEKAPPKPHKCAHSDLLLRLMVIARAGLESCGHCHKLVQIADEHRAFLLRDDVDRSLGEATQAYHERNRVVAALARVFPSGIRRTEIEGWDPEWHGCVFIDLPTGQASWHYHDREAGLFAELPPYTKPWDGHTTEEKYARLAALQPPAICAHRELALEALNGQDAICSPSCVAQDGCLCDACAKYREQLRVIRVALAAPCAGPVEELISEHAITWVLGEGFLAGEARATVLPAPLLRKGDTLRVYRKRGGG